MTTTRDQLVALDTQLQAIIASLPADPPVSLVPLSYPKARTDRNPQPKLALQPLGPAGFAWTDAAFPATPLMRLTDATTGAGLSYRTPSNLQARAWSSDGQLWYAVTTQGTIAVFNVTGKLQAVSVPFFGEPDFHPTVPATLIGGICDGTVLQVAQLDLTTGVRTVLQDVTALVATNLLSPRTYLRDVLMAANGTRVSAIFGGTGQDLDHFVLALPLPGGTTLVLDTLAGTVNGQPIAPTSYGWGWHVHGAWLDKSGRYLTVQGAAGDSIKGGLIVWDLQQNTVQALSVLPGGHIAVGYGAMVNQDAGSPWDAFQFQQRAFSALSTPSALISPVLLPEEIYLDSHTSWHHAHPDTQEPFMVGTYRFTFAGGPNPPISTWRAWDDEILAVSPNLPATVWRFGQHRSDPRYSSVVNGELVADPTKPSAFWASPRPQVSPDGRFVLFTSNWEMTLGIDPADGGNGAAARQDVFVMGPLA